MTFGSVLEIYTTYFGWSVYGVIWDLVTNTGLIYIPFIEMLFNNWRNPIVSAQRANPTALVSLKQMQWTLYPMFLVLFFAGIPLMPLSLDQLEYPKVMCSGDTTEKVEGGTTGTTFDKLKSPVEDIAGVPKIPLLWYLGMQMNSGAVRAVISGVSCFEDITGLDYKLRNLTLAQEPLRREFNRFVNECFLPVKAKFQEGMEGKHKVSTYMKGEYEAGLGTDWNAEDPFYVGSKYFMQTEGFYKPCVNPGLCGLHRFQARSPVDGWEYDATRDKDYSPSDITKGVGRPYCDEWWQPAFEPEKGLKDRLVDAAQAVEVSTVDSLKDQVTDAAAWAMAHGFWSGWTEEDSKDLIIKRLLTSERIDFTGIDGIVDTASLWQTEDTAVAGAAVLVGVGSGMALPTIAAVGQTVKSGGAAMAQEAAGFYVWMAIAKQAAPMVQAILFMLCYIVLPIYMIITGFSLGGVLSMLVFWFVLRFFTVIWVVAELLDAQLFAAMFPDPSYIGSVLSLNFNRVILDIVLSILFIGGPVILLGIVGMAGAKVAFGGGDALMSPLVGLGKSAGRGGINVPAKKG